MSNNPFDKLKEHPAYQKNNSEKKGGEQRMDRPNHNYNNNRNLSNPRIESIIQEINKAPSLSSILTPDKYALPGGYAEEIAGILKKDVMENKQLRNKNEVMNSTQLRKVFDVVKGIDSKIKNNPEKFEEYKGQIFLIMPQVAYAKGRGIIKEDFYNLMKACITKEKMKTKEDYYSFAKFMESIVAYFK